MPKLIAKNNDYVLGIRDTETVVNFQSKLLYAKRIMIVGNGGIATELVYEIEKCKVIWAIKDNCISHVYFDSHSAKFFDTKINDVKKDTESLSKRKKYTITSKSSFIQEKSIYISISLIILIRY